MVPDAVQPLTRDDLKGLPFKFPSTIIRFSILLFCITYSVVIFYVSYVFVKHAELSEQSPSFPEFAFRLVITLL
jgi:hypothetical protein